MEGDGVKGMVNRGVVEWGSVVNGSMVNGCMVDRGSMDNWVGGCRGVYGFTGVSNISNVSTISVINTVSDSLDSAVREGYVVASRGCVSVTSFSGTKVDSRVVISSSVSIGVSWGDIGVDRGGAISRWACRGSHGNSHKSSERKYGPKKITKIEKKNSKQYG